jgi:thiopeptide-type bacteriocin biosynthesis protein
VTAPLIKEDHTTGAILAVLAGTTPGKAAADAGISIEALADAVELYQAAGRAALHAQADAARGWLQAYVEFSDWDAAEHTVATLLDPLLHSAVGKVGTWWYIRKYPCWRLRLRPASTGGTGLRESLSTALDSAVVGGLISSWREGIYEPEALAFGGRRGMAIAHSLFHADSRAALTYLTRMPSMQPVGVRELSLLLCRALFTGARLDWYEQGDVWHRVTAMRPLPDDVPADRIPDLADDLRRLMSVDATPSGPLYTPPTPMAGLRSWAAAFHHAGHDLEGAARDGALQRGLRDILAHHVIFHWNRLGLPARTQAILARAARDMTMDITTPAAPLLAWR